MDQNKAVTYSLLAHIRQKSTLVKGPLDIFMPLVKRALSKMNDDGLFSGENINEIKAYTDKMFFLDFPYPVLRKILMQIAHDVNTPEHKKIILNHDDSFQIIGYHFTEIEETIEHHKKIVEQLEKLFEQFCSTRKEKINTNSIFEFIDSNRLGLSKYLANKGNIASKDYTIEAQFVEYFKLIPDLFEQIKGIYLGSIISSYIEFQTEEIVTNIELLFDTNFLLALIDLNTPESYHTAKTLLKVGEKQGFRFTVLMDTIQEMRGLLEAKANHFDESFLIKKIYPEDIYNACDRRQINKADLERIADNLEDLLSKEGISIIYKTDKYQNIARHSKEYEALQKYRNSKISALHDATATHYVRQKRGRPISKYNEVNCWFVNNAISRDNDFYRNIENKKKQPEQIKADDLLNILWLSNPSVNQNLDSTEIADIGLSSLMSVTLTENLPKTSLIRELDDNIHKYAQEKLKDEDIIRLSTRIANKELKDLKHINELAKLPSKEAFVKRLENEIEKQKHKEEERAMKFNKVLEEFQKQNKSLDSQRKKIDEKTKELDRKMSKASLKGIKKQRRIEELEKKLAEKEQKEKDIKINSFLRKKIRRWRIKSIVQFSVGLLILISGVVYFLYQASWDPTLAKKNFLNWQDNLIVLCLMFIGSLLFAYSWKMLYDCWFSHSQIENYKKGIKLPENLK